LSITTNAFQYIVCTGKKKYNKLLMNLARYQQMQKSTQKLERHEEGESSYFTLCYKCRFFLPVAKENKQSRRCCDVCEN